MEPKIDESSEAEVGKYALLALREANALGRLPTPVNEIVSALKLTVEKGISLDDGFLRRLYQGSRHLLKKAREKVLAFLDVRGRTIYLEEMHEMRRKFVTLHDAGHHVLPWQRDTYAFLEDDELTLDPEVRERFEQEANTFASEVLFQAGAFEREAADWALSVKTPIELSRRYGASCYSAVRRFVSRNHRACALIVLENPVPDLNGGTVAKVRRIIQSPAFTSLFGEVDWPESCRPEDAFWFTFPTRNPFGDPRTYLLRTRNSEGERCVLEAFNSGYNVLVLVIPELELRSRSFSGEV